MTQKRLDVEEEDEEELKEKSLERFIREGLTEEDKKKEGVYTEIRMPRWIYDLLREISKRTGQSMNKTTMLAVKKGALNLRNIEKEYMTAEMRRVLKQIAYCMAEQEGEFILDLLEARKIRVSNGEMKGRTTTLIWWTHGILTEIAEDLEVSMNTIILVALSTALLSSNAITERQKKKAIRVVEKFRSIMEQSWLICDAIFQYFPELQRRSIANEPTTQGEINKKLEEIQQLHPTIFFKYFVGEKDGGDRDGKKE